MPKSWILYELSNLNVKPTYDISNFNYESNLFKYLSTGLPN